MAGDGLLIDCWVVPEKQFARRCGWIGYNDFPGVVIIPFDAYMKESLISKESLIKNTYPCGWYARFSHTYAFGKIQHHGQWEGDDKSNSDCSHCDEYDGKKSRK